MHDHARGIGKAQVVSLCLPMAPSLNRVTTSWFLSNVGDSGSLKQHHHARVRVAHSKVLFNQ